MNMSDFAAMMASNGFDLSAMQSESQDINQASNIQSNTTIPMPANTIPTTIREQSDTDRLLAQFGAFTGPVASTSTNQNQTVNTVTNTNTNTNTAQAQQQQPINAETVNDDEVNALLASLNDGNVGGNDFSNFDFGDIDLSNLGDMSGLFNTSTIPTPNENPSAGTVPIDVAGGVSSNSNQPQPIQVPSQPQVEQAIPVPEIKQQSTNINTQTTTDPISISSVPIPGPDPNLVFDDTQPIDLDDFNFGDGDGGEEGGIDLTGDEFEDLLAAFN